MRLLLQYLARRLLVSALCAVTQTALVDHEYRQLRIDSPAITATADGSRESATEERVTARLPRPSNAAVSRASSDTLDLAETSPRFTGRGSAAGSTSAPG